MPQSPMRRFAVITAVVLALVGALFAAPSATASDRHRIGGSDNARPAPVQSRAVVATKALANAELALQGKGKIDATRALRDLFKMRDSLTPAQAARAKKLTNRPPTNRVDCGSKYACIHWKTGESTANWARLVKATTAKVAKTYRKAGYRAPKKDGRKGGNSKVDIYVKNLQPGLYGYCTVDNDTKLPGGGRFDVPAFCVVDNNYRGFPRSPKANLQVTVAHEFFHAVQYAYDVYEDDWVLEAMAAWVEDEVYPKINDNLQYLPSGQLGHPENPMDEFVSSTGAHYGQWIFFRYLSEKFRQKKGKLPKVVLDVFKAMDSKHGASKDQFSVQAINTALAKRGTSFGAEYARFADANRRSRSHYKEGAARGYPVAPLATAPFALSGVGDSDGVSGGLDHLTSATVRVVSSGNPSGSGLAMNINMDDTAAGSRAVVTVYPKVGGPLTVPLALNSSGDLITEVPFGSDVVNYVEVTFSNASYRFSNCYKYTTHFSCGGATPVDDSAPVSAGFQVVA